MTGAWYYDDGLDEHYADVESFESHYADEINGNAEPADEPADEPEPVACPHVDSMSYAGALGCDECWDAARKPALTNAPGQLRLPLGAAY